MGECQNCRMLASENAVLRRENARLQRENEHLKRRIRWLLSVIKRAQRYAADAYRKAAKAMSEHQPRGTWAFHKGVGETARNVYSRLK